MDRLLFSGIRPFSRVFQGVSFALLYLLMATAAVAQSEQRPFVTTWEHYWSPYQLEFLAEGDYEIHWENLADSSQSGAQSASGNTTVQLPGSGRYRVSITGDLRQFVPARSTVRLWESVEQWGDINWQSMQEMFAGVEGLRIEAGDSPQFREGASLEEAFANSELGTPSEVGHWDVSPVSNMRGAFYFARRLPSGLGSWDVSSVTDMSEMFHASRDLEFPSLAEWDVSSVVTMERMFEFAPVGEADFSGWDVSNVTNMRRMFQDAWFDADLSSWSFASVSNVREMLDGSTMSRTNYDRLLESLAAQDLPDGLYFGAWLLRYCSAAQSRDELQQQQDWLLRGDYQDCRSLQFVLGGADFGVVTPNQSLTLTAELENISESTLQFDALELISPSGQFTLLDTNCTNEDGAGELVANERCQVQLSAESGAPGLYEESLSIRLNGQAAVITLPVTMAVVPAKPDLEADWEVAGLTLEDIDLVELARLFDVLSVFYYRMDGENWTNNSGWLDPERHPCEWHGVSCWREGIGWPNLPKFHMTALNLSDNNLRGRLTSFRRLTEMGLGSDYFRDDIRRASVYPRVLQLNGNPLEGIDRLPTYPDVVLVERAGLAGALPPVQVLAGGGPIGLHLSLAGNAFSGDMPSSWNTLEYLGLDLAENAFNGSLDAFKGATTLEASVFRSAESAFWQYRGYFGMWWRRALDFAPLTATDFYEYPRLGLVPGLHAAGNRLTDIGRADPERQLFASLCFNDLSNGDDAGLESVLEGQAASTGQCQSVEREDIAASVNGSWYAPERDGEGINLMLLEDGSLVGIWYMHAEAGRQVWMLGQGRVVGKSLRFSPMSNYAGVFGDGYQAHPFRQRYPDEARGFGLYMQASVLSDNSLAVSQKAEFNDDALENRASVAGQEVLPFGVEQGNPYGGSAPGTNLQRLYPGMLRPLTRLTSIAGTSCDNQHPFQWLSGLWYEPASEGEGLMIEYTSNEQAVVYWYTYTPDGSEQAWMLGVGTFDGQRLLVENMRQPQHTGDVVFDTAGIEQDVNWGSLEIDFSDQSSGELRYDSVMQGYGSGTRQLTKLASPMMASGCEASVH